MTSHWIRLRRDPRYYQITSLSLLLIYGVSVLDFPVSIGSIGLIIASAWLTQWLFSQRVGISLDLKSPLISALSLCILLRSNDWWVLVLAALLAIASKFLLRVERRHIFNPTNFALVILLLFTDSAWVAHGQWGQGAYFSFLLASLGMLVVYRSRRSDVTYAFLVVYLGLLIGRAFWLGDPLAIPLHQLQSGALLLFAFFMLSDPKTVPDARPARILYATWVAALGYVLQYHFYLPNGLLYALVGSAFVVPLLNSVFPAERYEWPTKRVQQTSPGRRKTLSPYLFRSS